MTAPVSRSKVSVYLLINIKESEWHYLFLCDPGIAVMHQGAGDSGDIVGPKCRDLTFDESRQCRRCARVLISRQNTNLCHFLTTSGKLSPYNCTV